MILDNKIKLIRVGVYLKSLAKPEFLWWLIVAGGIILRLREYAEFLSLGNDESALARNIAERTFSGLTQPLDYHQGAPILFLFIQKIFITVFGNKDFILEIFPLFSGLLALLLIYRIARKHFGTAGLFAVFAFAISSWLVLYSADPKQYSSDVMIAVLLTYLSDSCINQAAQARDYLILGVTGSIAIWVSHPSAFVLAGIALVILFEKLSRKDYKALGWSLALGAAWAASLGIDFIISLRHLSADPYLVNYWHTGFVPLPPWSHPRWFVDTYLSLLTVSLGNTGTFFALFCLVLILIGCASILARKRILAFVLIFPFALAFAASLLQKYPLQTRFLLFLVPFVYLLMGEGLGRIYLFITKWNRALALVISAVIFVIVLTPGVVTAKRNFFNPQHHWDMRPAVDFIGKNWKAGDAFLVSGGGESFAYYSSTVGLHIGDILIDGTHRIIRYHIFIEDLQKFAGRNRVWIVFAHFEKGADYNRYAKYVSRHTNIEAEFHTGIVRVYLCDIYP